jgi:hypothetical protein
MAMQDQRCLSLPAAALKPLRGTHILPDVAHLNGTDAVELLNGREHYDCIV